MKDKLERFVTENRAGFDDAEPNPLLWLQLEKKLENRKQPVRLRRMMRITAVAASFVIVLAAGMLIGLNLQDQTPEEMLSENPQFIELQEAEHYFQKQVDYKMTLINDPVVQQDVKQDLSQLDAVYNEMKSELLTSPNKDNGAIIQAMIENYRIRIDMLEKILEKIQKNSTNHETNLHI